MRKMTVKDFIDYGGPCLECGQHMFLSVCTGAAFSSNWNHIPAVVKEGKLLISLKITYSDALIMVLDPKTNKYAVTGKNTTFSEYLKEHEMYLAKNCKCYSIIQSDYLQFNTEMSFIYPTTVLCEVMTVTDNRSIYRLTNYYGSSHPIYHIEESYGELDITPLDKKVIDLKSSAQPMKLPVMPRSRFRGKAHFLDKILTYLTFS